MRLLPTSLSKSLFLTLLLSLAADGAFAQTEVNITGVPTPAAEGSPSGTTNFVFTVSRSAPGPAVNVTYTLTGDVGAPEDYTAHSGILAFTAAQNSKTITVAVKRDTKFELDENLTLTLTGTDQPGVVDVGAVFTATTQVMNDDTPPTISIGNRTANEGLLGNFAVTLSNGSYLPVSVTATTADGTANGVVTGAFPAFADYTPNTPAGTVITFAANATVLTQQFAVATVADTVYEGGSGGTPETYFVNLSAPVNGSIGTGTGNGQIVDDELLPVVSIAVNAAQAESVLTRTFTVTLNRQSIQAISVTAAAFNGTASQTAGVFAVADFNPMAQVLNFVPGDVSETVNVTVIDDAIDEANETFSIQLGGLVNVGPGVVSRTATINDNDALPFVSIVPTSSPVGEGAGNATFTVSLSAVSGQAVSVTAQTVPTLGTATPGVDYTATGPQVFSWTPGFNAPQTFVVPILEDPYDEANETFRATLTAATFATANPSIAIMTITDNDPTPTVSISDVTVIEGNTSGPPTTTASFTVSLSAPSAQNITVYANTANGTATTSNSDYVQQTSVQLTFSPLQTTQQFNVTVTPDNVLEIDETFLVNLHSPSGTVTLGDFQGVGTITNDDSPALSIADVQFAEGGGTMLFTVSIPDNAPVGGVSFNYATSDGTATLADNDYVQVTGGVGFIAESTTSTTVPVVLNDDSFVEAYENFTVTISNATLPGIPLGIVTILDATAVGTIANDDAIPAGALVISEFRLSGPGGADDEFIEIANTTSAPITVFSTDTLAAGFSVAQAGGGYIFTIPNGTTIPARGHFLAANSTGYSLSNYGGLNAATPDATWTTGIADDTGLALFGTDDSGSYGLSTPLDAVGFAANVGTQYAEGPLVTDLLTDIGIGPFVHNYSFVRKHAMGPGAALQDTGKNKDDFALVAVDAGSYGTGPVTLALLGGPSPENLAAETERSNTEVTLSGAGSVFTGLPGLSPKALEFRRTFTNNTAGTLNAVRFKITSLTGVNSPGGVADLRPTSSSTAGPYLGLALEGMPSANYFLTTPAVFPYPVGGLPNGGLNSTWRVTPVAIAPAPGAGSTVDVNFRVEYTISGAPYLIWLVPEAK